MNLELNAAIQTIQAFAYLNGRVKFFHLCTSALQGEEWAIKRVTAAIERTMVSIDATDTDRPDGAVPRTFEP